MECIINYTQTGSHRMTYTNTDTEKYVVIMHLLDTMNTIKVSIVHSYYTHWMFVCVCVCVCVGRVWVCVCDCVYVCINVLI